MTSVTAFGARERPEEMLHESHAELACWGAAAVRESFAAYQAEFKHISRRAKRRFEERDWGGAQADALERLGLRDRHIRQAVEELRGVLGAAASDPFLREEMKAQYARDLSDRPDPELAKTFFNSVTRRIFGTVGVNPRAEFVSIEVKREVEPGVEPQLAVDGAPIFRAYPRRSTLAELLAAILRDCPFQARFRDLEGDARLAAAEIDAHLRANEDPLPIDAAEMLKAVFYRGKGAYLVGRLRRGSRVSPLILPLLHGEDGIYLDAVLLSPNDAAIVFSFTRSYFHVDVDRTAALVAFLKTILTSKKTSEIYISIGYNKHGKTVLYREIVEHLARTTDRFEPARGDRGMVMIVFTLPSLDVVFKVIRDRFAPPKTVSRQDVMRKYALVFRHDRAGRLVDAQEFEDLVFERDRFAPELLGELLGEAGDTVRVEGGRVYIRHLYTERRVVPLNLFIREKDESAARDALLDYGRSIRDLAATNTFPGDLLLKNFGVTRTGRVIFYDYDELCLVTDCNFREIPPARDEEDENSGEPWFYVGENDVFPEEFIHFLGLPERLRADFLASHGEVLTAAFWRRMQESHRAGEIVDIFPYKETQRLRNGRS
jgi:isocitrate dehydrogenase kinase/phosphatase